GGNLIWVFPLNASGDAAPIRVIKGPDTQLRGVESVAVDPVNNIVAVGVASGGGDGEQGGIPRDRWGDLSYPAPVKGKNLIFDRTGDGNGKALRVIGGPRTEIVRILQVQVYPKKGWVIATQAGRPDVEEPPGVYVGVWSVHDDGDVAARWKLAGPKT